MQPAPTLTILTGASRGLGAAIAEQLLQRGATLLTMSRHPDPTLNAKDAETGASLEQWAIASGAGKTPLSGTAAHCAAKAGLDHFSRVVALDEASGPRGAMIVLLAPGVIDTDMQTDLRESDPRDFLDHPRFVAMKSQGQTSSPGDAATKILIFSIDRIFGTNPVADVRNS